MQNAYKTNSQMFLTVNCGSLMGGWGVRGGGREVGEDSLLPASFLRTWLHSTLDKNSIEIDAVALKSVA